MTDTTPTPREGERIKRALQRAFAADPMDRMLPGLPADDGGGRPAVRRPLAGPGRPPGRIEPLHATDRMKVKPLRILRGFLHRLDAGFNTFRRVNAGEGTASHVKRPGHGFVTEITSGDGILDGTGRMGGFAWNQALTCIVREGRESVTDGACLTASGASRTRRRTRQEAWSGPSRRRAVAEAKWEEGSAGTGGAARDRDVRRAPARALTNPRGRRARARCAATRGDGASPVVDAGRCGAPSRRHAPPSFSSRSRSHVTWVRAQPVRAARSRSSCMST